MYDLGTMDFKGKKVAVVGLAREGVALTRYLAEQGAKITVSDGKTAAQLKATLAQIAGLSVNLSLGANRTEDLLDADIVFVSPGVPRGLPALVLAQEKGVQLSSETELFMSLCPARVVGITGSSGKTTTTTLVGEFLRESGFDVFVGGNIGVPLIGQLPEIRPHDLVVLELSSFQLQYLRRSPQIALITNITPNHLDRHASMEEYIAAKENIVAFQRPSDFTIVNAQDPITREIGNRSKTKVFQFSQQAEVERGTFVGDGKVIFRLDGQDTEVVSLSEIRLLGRHNVDNVLAASAVALCCGGRPTAVRSVLARFTGVEHRLEPVRLLDGVTYYNDSIATTPERTVAALRSFSQPIVLLAGGRDKHLPLDTLVAESLRRCRAVVLFGEAAPLLGEALGKEKGTNGGRCIVRNAGDLAAATVAARQLARSGDVVLLSPACTSFDSFVDFEERGRVFRSLVSALT